MKKTRQVLSDEKVRQRRASMEIPLPPLDKDILRAIPMMQYRRLAASIIALAVRDFEGTSGDHPKYSKKELSPTTVALRKVRRRLEAGRFLVERRDGIAAFWFHTAGVARESWKPARWRTLMAALRREEQALMDAMQAQP